jgi:hypothetical protein
MGSAPAQQGKGDVTQFKRDTELPQAATARFPWLTVPRSSDSLSDSNTRRRERPDPSDRLVPAGGQCRAARLAVTPLYPRDRLTDYRRHLVAF